MKIDSVTLPIPHIQQRGSGDCLAACAAMVLTYLGLPTAYEQLLKLLQVKWFGTSSANIRQLEKLGLTVIYKQGTLEELHNHLTNKRPCVAFVRTSELPYWNETGDHAVVVIGLDSDYIHLNDPAFAEAPIRVSHGDFDLAWLERDEVYATFMRD
ncbi:cysteine peptidase family C39 domain-containing protein [Anaerolineales bacterium HSG25]|nr:cysteine peptidase family C39 domain-containing protein [Anaerolineales bacterium HSG25]